MIKSAWALGCLSILVSASAYAGMPVKILEFNVQYGCRGTDNVVNCQRTATYIKNQNPDLVALVETLQVQPVTSTSLNNPAKLASSLNSLTGKTWHYFHVVKFPGVSNGEGVTILTPWPILSTSLKYMSADVAAHDMPIAEATVQITKVVNGVSMSRDIQFFATHFDWVDESGRILQAQQLLSYLNSFPEPKIVAGDFNANETNTSIQIIENGQYNGITYSEPYHDTWDLAYNMSSSAGTYCHGHACGYSDNLPGLSSGFPYIRTRKSRVDHIFFSKNATSVSVSGASVPDSRAYPLVPAVEKLGTSDDKGIRPSDHNLYITNLIVN